MFLRLTLAIFILFLLLPWEVPAQEPGGKPTKGQRRAEETLTTPVVRRTEDGLIDSYWRYGNVKVHIRESEETPDVFEHFTYGEFEIEKDREGRAANYTVVLGDVRYYDLNGDGVIDRMYDGRTPKRGKQFIFFEGRLVEVRDGKTAGPVAISRDGLTEYRLHDGRWVVEHTRQPAAEVPTGRASGAPNPLPPSEPVSPPKKDGAQLRLQSPTPEVRARFIESC